MKMRIVLLLALFSPLALPRAAQAANAVNKDAEPRTLVVTENGDQSDVAVAPVQTVQFCDAGCFVTLPNGDREALTGTETIEIFGGKARIK